MSDDGGRLEFHNGVGRALEAAVFPLLALLLFALSLGFVGGFLGLLVGYEGPVDYVYVEFTLGAGLIAGLLLLFPVFILGRSRERAVLTAEGVPARRAAWRDVTGIRPVWRGYARLVGVRRRGGRRLLLRAPIGAWWRPDPGFASRVKTIRRYAAERGASVNGRVPGRWGVALAVCLTLSVAAAGAGFAVVTRGVVSPWHPVATSVGAACAELRAAGLDRRWPSEFRALKVTGPTSDKDAAVSSCFVEPSAEAFEEDVPYRAMSLHVIAWRSRHLSSGIATAMYEVDRERERPGAVEVRGVGDEAVMRDDGAVVTVLVRRANVTIRMRAAGVGEDVSDATRQAARELATGVLSGIRLRS
ncbi:MAG: hypothetical protein GEU94_17755 [Micromonosporaceae bacterium]|nr:hypothetical protein [Micromonosporaceae bacterium]